MALEIVPAEAAHVHPIAARMRADDVIEASAFGHTPETALRIGMAGGDAWTALVDDAPEAMFGLVIASVIDGDGRPWMLGSDAIYRHGRDLVKLGPEWIGAMFDSTRRLANLVSASNTRAIRLLERWGFLVEQDEQMIGGVAFRAFGMERERV